MQAAGAFDAVKFALNTGNSLFDAAPVGLELGFPGAAKEAAIVEATMRTRPKDATLWSVRSMAALSVTVTIIGSP